MDATKQKMQSIDDEILELEKLIALQQRKVELLRKKNDLSTTSTADEDRFGIDDEMQLKATLAGSIQALNSSDLSEADSDVLLNRTPSMEGLPPSAETKEPPYKITIHSNHDTLSRMSAFLK